MLESIRPSLSCDITAISIFLASSCSRGTVKMGDFVALEARNDGDNLLQYANWQIQSLVMAGICRRILSFCHDDQRDNEMAFLMIFADNMKLSEIIIMKIKQAFLRR